MEIKETVGSRWISFNAVRRCGTNMKHTIYISFYAAPDGQGGAFREQLISHHFPPMHGWLIRMAERKARELGAKSFVMFQAIPRIFTVEDPDGA